MEPGMDSTEAAASSGQQRAFSQLASYRNRNGNTVSPTKSEAGTKSIVQNTNGTSTTLHYPIVTEPGSRRRGFGMPSFRDTLTKTRDFLGLTESQGREDRSQSEEERGGGEGQPRREHEGAGQGEGAAPAPGGHQWVQSVRRQGLKLLCGLC